MGALQDSSGSRRLWDLALTYVDIVNISGDIVIVVLIIRYTNIECREHVTTLSGCTNYQVT
jgi:hypothetical protein